MKGFIEAALAGYNDLPSYRGVMDTEGAGGPADVSLIGTEAEVLAGMRAFADAGATDFAPGGARAQPRRRRRDPRAAQGRGRRRARLMGAGTGALTPVDVLGGAVRAAGIVELEPTDRGIVLHRMPAWARVQHNDIALAMLETMPSGGRLEMVTDATTIELDVHAHARAARHRARHPGGVRPGRRRRAGGRSSRPAPAR